jgi:hypothetical protein
VRTRGQADPERYLFAIVFCFDFADGEYRITGMDFATTMRTPPGRTTLNRRDQVNYEDNQMAHEQPYQSLNAGILG